MPQPLHSTRRGGVQKEDEQAPERHEVEAPLGLVVVRRPQSVAAEATAAAVLPRLDANLDGGALRAGARQEPDVGVDERLERVDEVQ